MKSLFVGLCVLLGAKLRRGLLFVDGDQCWAGSDLGDAFVLQPTEPLPQERFVDARDR